MADLKELIPNTLRIIDTEGTQDIPFSQVPERQLIHLADFDASAKDELARRRIIDFSSERQKRRPGS